MANRLYRNRYDRRFDRWRNSRINDLPIWHPDLPSTGHMKIDKEPFSLELFEEILPLAQKCWHESTTIKAETCAFYGERDFDVEPDVDQYRKLSELGSLLIMTLRGYGRLCGYATGILYRSMHHKKILCAMGDTIYIEPEFRSYTSPFAERFEAELAAAGVGIIGWPTSASGPLYQILKARGYVGDDTVMEKRLCASLLQ